MASMLARALLDRRNVVVVDEEVEEASLAGSSAKDW